MLFAVVAAAVVETLSTPRLPAPAVITVMTPPSYAEEPARRYPVLYFLHDGYGDEKVLYRNGVAQELFDEMRAGRLPELLVVTPRASASWYVDSFDEKTRYASFLTRDLVPFIDRNYRTVASREGRAAMGISMGGYGAMRWALDQPGLFTVVVGLSPAFQQLTWNGVEALPFFLRPMLKRVFGKDDRANSLRRSDLYDTLLSDPTLASRVPEVLVRCGTEDKYRLSEITTFFSKFLDAVGVRNSLVLEPGVHDWPYWKRVLPELVREVGTRLAPGTARSARVVHGAGP
jgi:S-formylglutathione hydrolase FrmB